MEAKLHRGEYAYTETTRKQERLITIIFFIVKLHYGIQINFSTVFTAFTELPCYIVDSYTLDY